MQKSNFKGARVFQPAILSLLAGKKTRPPLLLQLPRYSEKGRGINIPKEGTEDEKKAEKDLQKFRDILAGQNRTGEQVGAIKRVSQNLRDNDVTASIGINGKSKDTIEDIFGKKTVFIVEYSLMKICGEVFNVHCRMKNVK